MNKQNIIAFCRLDVRKKTELSSRQKGFCHQSQPHIQLLDITLKLFIFQVSDFPVFFELA